MATVVLVGNQRSIHVRRWRSGLESIGHEVVPVDLSAGPGNALGRRLGLIRVRWRIGRLARRPNTVVAEHYVPGGLLAMLMRGLHPVVLSVWGHDVTGVRPGWRGRFYERQLRAYLRRATAVTATSGFLADTVRSRFGVESTIVAFGIDTARFTPADSEIQAGSVGAVGAAAPSAGPPLRIGFVKWLRPKYAPDVLVEALGLLRDRLDFEITFVGDGEMRATLEARVRALAIGDRVQFLGSRPHDEIPSLLRGFDLLAMPSREEEWGVSAAEAGAAGLPVVAARVGGVPEIVVDGETGILVPPEDPVALSEAILRLAHDPQLGRSMGRAGRARVAELFDWKGCVEAMSRILNEAARERR